MEAAKWHNEHYRLAFFDLSCAFSGVQALLNASIVNAQELVCSVSRVELSITAASVIILMTESVIGNTLICVLQYEWISAAFLSL